MPENQFRLIGPDTAKDENISVDARFSEFDGFLDDRDRKPLDTFRLKAFGTLDSAVAVCVRFHDRHDLGVAADKVPSRS